MLLHSLLHVSQYPFKFQFRVYFIFALFLKVFVSLCSHSEECLYFGGSTVSFNLNSQLHFDEFVLFGLVTILHHVLNQESLIVQFEEVFLLFVNFFQMSSLGQ